MFTHTKKDYYSVNCDIAVEANQQQRIYEAAVHLTQAPNQMAYADDDEMMQEEAPTHINMEQLPDMNTEEMKQTQMMIADQMGPTAIRYDEVYYPRTDKRAISK